MKFLARIMYSVQCERYLSFLIITSAVIMVLALFLFAVSYRPRVSVFIERHRTIALAAVLIIWGVAIKALTCGVLWAVNGYIGVSTAPMCERADDVMARTAICTIFGGVISFALVVITAVVVNLTSGRSATRVSADSKGS